MDISILDGDLYAAGDPAHNGLPHDRYDYLRIHAPCHREQLHDPLMVDAAWVVTRYDDVQQVAREPRSFVSGRGVTLRLFENVSPDTGGKPSMLTLDADDHVRNRRVMSGAFTPKVLRAFDEHLRRMVVDVVDRAVARESFDLVPELSKLVPLHAICDLLGVPDEDRAQVLEWTDLVSVPTDPDFTPSPEESMAAVLAIWNYGVRLVSIRRERPAPDLFTQIARAHDQGLISDDEIMGNTLLLIVAGNETTRNAISHGIHALVQHPEQMAIVREQAQAREVTMAAVDEVLRWSSPILYMCRRAVEDVELHGAQIKAGDPVALHWGAANFDPERFADPTVFDVTRAPNPHLTFGVGQHFCIGAHVARLEIKMVLEELLRRTRAIEATARIVYSRDAFLRGVKSLPLIAAPA